jgi:predicted O-methyltransferase YrrM
MMSDEPISVPPIAAEAEAFARRGQFYLSCEHRTGALLRTLAASKPGGRVLEVGSGVGVGAAWLLDGMDSEARLITIEKHPKFASLCRQFLAGDSRAEVITADANDWLESYSGPSFDLIFVDTTTTKFDRRDLLYAHMADGALLIADDLLPGDTWTKDHPARVERFRGEIMKEPDLVPALIDWASGLVVATFTARHRD